MVRKALYIAGLAALVAGVNVANAGEAMVLAEKQMDKVTAGAALGSQPTFPMVKEFPIPTVSSHIPSTVSVEAPEVFPLNVPKN